MAMIECRECHKQVSDTAAACPACGAPVKISIAHGVDPKSAKIFKNPATHETVSIADSWLWVLIFGLFYFLYRHAWTQALLSFIFAICTFGVSWFLYPFFARQVMRTHFVSKGWIALR